MCSYGMHTAIILASLFVVVMVFYVREQYTTYPTTTERRLNTIKQLSDDVIRDLQKMTTGTTGQPYTVVQPPRPIQPPQQGANMPDWVKNLSADVAVQQLQLLNPGFTVRKIQYGQPVSLNYVYNRITVTHDSGDRVVSISQG